MEQRETIATAEIPPALPGRQWILEGGVFSSLVRLAWPLWTAMALQDAYTLVDLFWVGRLGKEAIAAVALSGVLMGFVFTVAMGISTGVVAIVARMWGAGEKAGASHAAWQALYLGLATGVVSTALGLALAEPALTALGAEGQVLELGVSYLRVMACDAVAIFLMFSLNSALRGAGDMVTPMFSSLTGTVVNVFLDPILIFGLLGLPALGVTGSAVSTVLSEALGMILVSSLMLSGRTRVSLAFPVPAPDFAMFWRIFRIGIWGSLQMWFRSVSSIAIMSVVTLFGDSVIAAYGIGIRMTMIVLLPGFGVGNAAATMIGQNLGAGRAARAVRAGWAAFGFYAVICAAFAAVFLLAGRTLVGLFNTDPEVVAHGARYLAWLAVSLPFVGFAVVLGRALSGAGETLGPMIITAAALLGLQIPAAVILSRSMGPEGIWLGIAATNAVNGLGVALLYVRGEWTRKKV